jgi:hypothetical protein
MRLAQGSIVTTMPVFYKKKGRRERVTERFSFHFFTSFFPLFSTLSLFFSIYFIFSAFVTSTAG